MVLYNVTVGIDREIETEWLRWMIGQHVPDVMATGMFKEYRIFKVISQDQEESSSYSFQYFATSMDKIEEYLEHHAPRLIAAHQAMYRNRHVAFRTLLQEVI